MSANEQVSNTAQSSSSSGGGTMVDSSSDATRSAKKGETAVQFITLLCALFRSSEDTFDLNFNITELQDMPMTYDSPHMHELKQKWKAKFEKRSDKKREAFLKTLGKHYKSNDPSWSWEMRSQYMRQVFRLSSSIELYRRKRPVVFEYFNLIVLSGKLSMSFFLTGLFIQQKYFVGKEQKSAFPVRTATPFQV